jgi:amidase
VISLTKDHRVFAFDGAAEPALRVPAGARVRLETADCFDDQVQGPGDALASVDWDRVNPATGPVFVEGAAPGDALAVSIERVDIGAQGVMAVAPGFGVLGEEFAEIAHRIVPIEAGTAKVADGITVPLRPMIGVIGVAPAGGPVATASPGPHGGNMDTRLIGAGTVLYLPVAHVGALFAAGDLHAAMGDGEICGTGVEVAGGVTVRLDVRRDLHIADPVLVTPDAYVTIASSETLDAAAEAATRQMVRLLTDRLGVSLELVTMLMSAGGDLQVSQIVDPLRTARFSLPRSVVAGLGRGIFQTGRHLRDRGGTRG